MVCILNNGAFFMSETLLLHCLYIALSALASLFDMRIDLISQPHFLVNMHTQLVDFMVRSIPISSFL